MQAYKLSECKIAGKPGSANSFHTFRAARSCQLRNRRRVTGLKKTTKLTIFINLLTLNPTFWDFGLKFLTLPVIASPRAHVDPRWSTGGLNRSYLVKDQKGQFDLGGVAAINSPEIAKSTSPRRSTMDLRRIHVDLQLQEVLEFKRGFLSSSYSLNRALCIAQWGHTISDQFGGYIRSKRVLYIIH